MSLILDLRSPEALRPGIARAAAILRQGGLVAFPTETVYGLAAHALNAEAVRRIYQAKGRPATNPVIVHVAERDQVRELVTDWPASAERLAKQFWPGPLTLVLPRQSTIPDLVTAGGPLVAVRIPAHPVALALLRETNLPLAGPSANRSNRLSPTTAEHVRRDLEGRIDLILDAGPTPGGLESTVLDLSGPPRLLRPGLLSVATLEAVIGPIACEVTLEPMQAMPSPGMLRQHYAPRTPLEVVAHGEAVELTPSTGLLTFPGDRMEEVPEGVIVRRMPEDPAEYAQRFYATLHELDDQGLTRLVVVMPPEGEEWRAVRDRLRRAAAR